MEREMKRKVMAVCISAGLLGLLATALSLAAEAKRIKESEIRFTSPSGCTYPRSPVLTLGLAAATVLSLAQTIISVTTAFLCCEVERYQSQCSWTVALLFSSMSWLTYLLAVFILVTGASSSIDNNGNQTTYYGYHFCYFVKRGLFATAAFLSLSAVVSGILAYITVQLAKNRGDPRAQPAAAGQPGIAMGQTQYSERRSQDPAFVHEDTYMRRQLA